jgi:GTP pyrophosphokinase
MSRTSVSSDATAAREQLLSAAKERFSATEVKQIAAAADLAERGHAGQRRGTGEPYVCHPFAVAEILTGWKLDVPTITAAVLHDLPEDTDITLDEVRTEFGDEVAELVEAVTKLSAVRIPHAEIEYEVENLRRLFLAMAKDLRVVLLKLADRLHNARTIKGMKPPKRPRYGREILEIYAPLADRLGMGEVRSELSEIGFQHADPKSYEWTRKQVQADMKKSERYLARVKREFAGALADEGVTANINARTKNTYSLYRKLTEKQRDLNRIYDLLAIRIIVDTPEECYRCMGIIHQRWQPLPHRIKDYIAVPKLNGYRSLHTTIFGPDEKLLEVQFRTWEMHDEAEHGVSAHAIYAEAGKKNVKASDEQVAVIKQLKSWQEEIGESTEFIQRFKLDMFADRIFVFTPGGTLHSLPAGSTPVDFAYAVHTEVGDRCQGAKVNGVIVPLDAPLVNGDVVEILTRREADPKSDWLRFVRTGHARSSIRRFLRNHGQAGVAPAAEPASKGSGKTKSATKAPRRKPPARRSDDRIRISVSGAPDVPTRIAACCKPQPGDRIVGYVTVGKKITVHAEQCRHLQSADPSRLIAVRWERTSGKIR